MGGAEGSLLLDTITINQRGVERRIQLMQVDLTALPADESVDVLVVSAFKDDYIPVPGTVIGALHRVGVSGAELATDKEVDLRRFSSCWLSKPLGRPDLGFQRILCFEPRYRGQPA